MTFTLKTVPQEVLDFRDDSGHKRRGSSNEEIKVYGRTDLTCPPQTYPVERSDT
jgi:hypothetical protein